MVFALGREGGYVGSECSTASKNGSYNSETRASIVIGYQWLYAFLVRGPYKVLIVVP